jgi:poly-beta-1,6-N-acetyl-D-glucosamine biosynthesis protein PgaD
MKQRAPIINRPQAATRTTRMGWRVLATLMWGTWLACWVPLLTLGIWEFGLYRINGSLTMPDGVIHLRQMVVPGLAIIAAQSACLLGWAAKDYLRFGRLQRRQQALAADLIELAHYAQVSGSALAHWQLARCLIAEHDEQGRFDRARIYQPGTAAVATETPGTTILLPLTIASSLEVQRIACSALVSH